LSVSHSAIASPEEIQRAVDRRLPDPLSPVAQLLLDVFYREVPVRREHDVRDLLALLGDGETLLAQVSEKQMSEGHAPLSGALNNNDY
jgi:hypothetical protein